MDVSLTDYQGFPVSVPSKFDSGLFPDDTPEDKSRARSPDSGSSVKPTLWNDRAWENYQMLARALTVAGFTGISSEW